MFSPERTLILLDLGARDEALDRLVQATGPALRSMGATAPDVAVLAALREREAARPTSTPEGVAFPHALLTGLRAPLVSAALLRPALDFGVAEHPRVSLVFMLVGATERPWEHVRMLARLARLVRAPGALETILESPTSAALFERLRAAAEGQE